MAFNPGSIRNSWPWTALNQALRNRFGNAGVISAGTSPGQSPPTAAALAPFATNERWFKLYRGAAVAKTLRGVSIEYAYANGTTAGVEAIIAADADAPLSMHAWLRPRQFDWGTGTLEVGNVEIVGLDPAGVPGYCFVSVVQVPAGLGVTNAGNMVKFLVWNDKHGTFDEFRVASHSAKGDRINSWGRFVIGRTNAPGIPPFGGTLYTQWIDYAGTLASPIAPFGVTGAADMQMDTFTLGAVPEIDANVVAASLPTLLATDVAGATVVDITVPARLFISNSFGVAGQYVGGGLNPAPVHFWISLPTDQFSANAQLSRIQIGSDDTRKLIVTAAAIAAAIAPPFPDAAVTGNYCDRAAKLENDDLLLIEWCAWIGNVGDDLTTF